MTNIPTCSDNDASPACKPLAESAIPLEILTNLTFLTLNYAEHPDRIRLYAHIAEEQLKVLRQILFPQE